MAETSIETRAGRTWIDWLNMVGPLIGLAAVFGLFAALAPSTFLSMTNMETIARQSAIVGTAALGMTMIIIAGGIDLSAGSVIALATVVVAVLLRDGHGTLVSAMAAVAVCAGCGAINGGIITKFRMVPFIVTLGMLLIVRGAAKGLAGELTVYPERATWLEGLLRSLGPGKEWMIVPPGVWLMVVLAVIVWVALRYTRFGRHVFAVGSNELTARLCGVPVERVKLMVYVLGAAFAGVAGVMQFSRLTVGDPTVAVGLELNVIAAVVIGGGSLSGGEGSVLGSIVGALIMTIIANGCVQIDLPNWVQEIVTGSVIVVAVGLDRLRHRRE